MDAKDVKKIPSSILGRIEIATSVEEGTKTDIGVETVVENTEEKKKMFIKQLDQYCPTRAILASNTSFLNIFDFVEPNRSDKVLIAHWYTPLNLYH